MKKRSKRFWLIFFLIFLSLGFLAVYYKDNIKVLAGVVYASIFGLFTLNGIKFPKNNKYLDAIKENRKSIDDALKLAKEIEETRSSYTEEVNKRVQEAKEETSNMSVDDLVDFGNELLLKRRNQN